MATEGTPGTLTAIRSAEPSPMASSWMTYRGSPFSSARGRLVSKSTTGSGGIAHRNAMAEVSTGSFIGGLLGREELSQPEHQQSRQSRRSADQSRYQSVCQSRQPCRTSALASIERRRTRRAVMAPVRAYILNLRLQEHRTRLDLTQEAVAEELARLAWVHSGMRVGVNADMVGKWERGEKRPSKLYRRLLCLLYQATEEELGLRVNRRDFLRHSALTGAALLAFSDWLSRAGATEASDRLAWMLEQP